MGGVNTFWAPVHRALKRQPIGNAGFPLNAAPSLDYLGAGIQDHRWPYNAGGSSANQPGILGWFGGGSGVVTAHYVPSTIAAANIAALANAVSGTPLALVSSSGAGITVLTTAAPAKMFPGPATSVSRAGGTNVTAGVAIDGLPALNSFGSNGNFVTGLYQRAAYVGRAVSITGVSGGAGGAFLVSGYDPYGFPQTETVTAPAGVATTAGKKGFKVITSVTPQFSDAHNYSVGTADVFGFGLLALFFPDVTIWWNNALITASTGFTAGDQTSPATATTGDVRGTYAVQSASDGAKRLVMQVRLSPGQLLTSPTAGMFGVTPA